MKKILIPERGNSYKANLHCHTNLSDGKLSPEELKRLYKSHGYSVLAYTDHDIMVPHGNLADPTFLPLLGYEMEFSENDPSGDTARNKYCHICLIAPREDARQVCFHKSKYLFGAAPLHKNEALFDPSEPDFERSYTPECINEVVRRARESGFFVTYNHPTWSCEGYESYSKYRGFSAMEIINYGCKTLGFDEYNARVYDDMLRLGNRLFCIAADDNHNTNRVDSDSLGAFTVIRADSLTYEDVFSSLKSGRFYSSEGPKINALWVEDGIAHIRTSPAARISFTTGTRHSASFTRGGTSPLCYAEFKLERSDTYFRASLEDANGKRAYTNAYFTDEII